MQVFLYHREVFMPTNVRNLGKTTIVLRPTRHASEAAQNDRYGCINIPRAIEFSGKDLVEIELTNGRLTKCVARLPYDARHDAIFVFLPDGTLKTVWLNRRNDKHKTLRRELYKAA